MVLWLLGALLGLLLLALVGALYMGARAGTMRKSKRIDYISITEQVASEAGMVGDLKSSPTTSVKQEEMGGGGRTVTPARVYRGARTPIESRDTYQGVYDGHGEQRQRGATSEDPVLGLLQTWSTRGLRQQTHCQSGGPAPTISTARVSLSSSRVDE